ncbi:hypothetical protein TIFTF001_034475 [Ficus carica]|uniref:Uncharacterized protein n=1 Tax=Ficus carica TaxID=3494 RepID=A0AA88J959_FICCA|nr:hypothetical protein TIFTF001_034475 [Ficus carica]
MLPYIPLGRPTIQTLCFFRSGLPPEILQFMPLVTPEMTLDEKMEAVMGAEILANMVRAVPEVPTPMYEDDHPLAPMTMQAWEIPPHEGDAGDTEMDPADHPADPEEDPPVIIIASDDEEEQDEEEEDPEEILFNDDEE